MKWGRTYQLWRHATDTFAILVVRAQNSIWDEWTLPSGFICGRSMQQYPIPRPVSSENMFSFRLSGLCLSTWHATCFAIINVAQPIGALHHGKTATSGERCLKASPVSSGYLKQNLDFEVFIHLLFSRSWVGAGLTGASVVSSGPAVKWGAGTVNRAIKINWMCWAQLTHFAAAWIQTSVKLPYVSK